MSVTTRAELISYAKRRLGEPVIEVNVSDEQMEDRLDDALQFFQDFHSDATENLFLPHQVTSSDITNKSIPIPDSIIYVRRILPLGGITGGSTGSLFNVHYQMHLNDFYDMGKIGDLTSYTMMMQYQNLLQLVVTGKNEHFHFSRHMNKLAIHMDWDSDIREGDYLVVECVGIIDPETYANIYNDRYLKEYYTELCRLAWGTNLSKFEGMTLPGGVTLNGRQMIEDAKENLIRLQEEIRLVHEEPPHFFIG